MHTKYRNNYIGLFYYHLLSCISYPMRLVAYDLETCIMQRGYTRGQALILEIGGVDVLAPERTFHCFVNPCPDAQTKETFLKSLVDIGAREYPTKRHAENIHYDPSLALPIEEALRRFLAFLTEGNPSTITLSAHNGRSFDDKIVSGALERHNLLWPENIQFLDSYHAVSKKAWPARRSYKLQNLHKTFCPEASSLKWHTALDDSIALSHLLKAAARETVATRIEDAAVYIEQHHGVSTLNREFHTQFPSNLTNNLGRKSKLAAQRKLRQSTGRKITCLCIKICLGASLWLSTTL